MGTKSYTIGDVARLSGEPVRRIRFYSDKGILPPSGRSDSNYRLYTEADIAKLDLIRALREAGVDLAAIRRLLGRKLSLHEFLQARLEILETEIATKRRAASIIRATLRVPNPEEDDLRRIWTMSKVSNQQMKQRVEAFVDRIAVDAKIDDAYRQRMIELSVPQLPDDPTQAQIEAWNELATMLADNDFVREFKQETQKFWTGALDPVAYQAAATRTFEAASQALGNDISPQSDEGRQIALGWLEFSAAAMGREPNAAFVQWQVAQYDNLAGRIGRFRELIAELKGEASTAADRRVWTWIIEALKALKLD